MYEVEEIDLSLARVDAMAKVNDELAPLLDEIYRLLAILKDEVNNENNSERVNGLCRGLGRLITDSYDFMQTSVAQDLTDLLDRIRKES